MQAPEAKERRGIPEKEIQDAIFWAVVPGFVMAHWWTVFLYHSEWLDTKGWLVALKFWEGLSSLVGSGFFGAFSRAWFSTSPVCTNLGSNTPRSSRRDWYWVGSSGAWVARSSMITRAITRTSFWPSAYPGQKPQVSTWGSTSFCIRCSCCSRCPCIIGITHAKARTGMFTMVRPSSCFTRPSGFIFDFIRGWMTGSRPGNALPKA